MKNQKGFTLIEVMAILIILLILTGAMVPSFHGISTLVKLKTSARTLSTDIRYTQQLAIATKKPTTIAFDKSQGTYKIMQSENGIENSIKLGNLTEGVSIEGTTFTNEKCTFAISGNPNGGSIYMVYEDKYYTITVRPITGRVVIFDYKKLK